MSGFSRVSGQDAITNFLRFETKLKRMRWQPLDHRLHGWGKTKFGDESTMHQIENGTEEGALILALHFLPQGSGLSFVELSAPC